MLLRLDFSSQIPIYRQIRDQIVVGIASGELAPGEKLPAIRALAEQSGVNMMTVSNAYTLLKQEGLITTDRLGPQTLVVRRMICAEARPTGLSEADFLDPCREFYREGGGEK